MKMAQGYVTDDGTFFESKMEAGLHEAESHLRAKLAIEYNDGVDPDKFLAIVIMLMPELWGYINAYHAADTSKQHQQAEVEDRAEVADSGKTESVENLGHVSSAEEDLAALLKLPTRGPSHVSNVGSGPRTEEVPKRREEHGPRVRRANASGVRSRKDMAVKQDTKA